VPDTPRAVVIQISSEVTPEGAYVVAVHPTPDLSVALDRERALRYGISVLTAAHYADYEAALWAQMRAAGVGVDAVFEAVSALRAQRRALDHEATAPLSFDPIISAKTRQGVVKVLLNGEQIGQLDSTDAAEHAHIVLAAVASAELDGLYYQWLRETAQVKERTARGAVTDLARHQTGWLARR
jgi:hypothetical protein